MYSSLADGKPAVYIADNGAGFAMNFAEQLFQPFRRLHRHGGRIQARAVPGQGAKISFSFPQGEANETT